ncbi:MAG TPA: cytochrome c oxidase subunit 3 [Roseiarcus sp.]|jgi:cytochrome c oxidase subunit 3|nr:cytochrome c oxidase subunit 3 [Roseiarcus sp.]
MSESAINASAGIALPDPLREPWSDIARQREAATFGMWLFLMSEMLFFGAVFMAFSFTRALNVAEFQHAARHTEIVYGAPNTFVLVTSSLAMTIAVRAANIANRRLCARLLGATAILGFVFLVIKGLEYKDDLEHHLYPTLHFALGHNATQIFWAFYWIMTGIHAFHLTVGVGLVSRLTWLVHRNQLSLRSPQLEVTSLYWHLVDAFWIVLFPVLYVMGRG